MSLLRIDMTNHDCRRVIFFFFQAEDGIRDWRDWSSDVCSSDLSTAKILARAVNCTSDEASKPCNECQVCRSILDYSNLDVIEIDAASNNSVDDIRELRDTVKYTPNNSKYKVYIIDEVHMLSSGAFNALLKTLEEPPSHVIFVLATTEPQKIPATILSRCQRFDFKRVSMGDLISKMKEICSKEQIEIDEDSLRIIASNGQGSVRDTLS